MEKSKKKKKIVTELDTQLLLLRIISVPECDPGGDLEQTVAILMSLTKEAFMVSCTVTHFF